MRAQHMNKRWVRQMIGGMLGVGFGLACSQASAVAALTDAGVGIINEGDFFDAHPDQAYLTRTTFYAGEGLLTEASATFGYRPAMYAVVDAGIGRWGQAIASLSDTVTFTSTETQRITVQSTVAGYWSGHGGGTRPVSRVEVTSALGPEVHLAYTYPAGNGTPYGVFTYLVDPSGPDWTPGTLQRGSYSQQIAWTVYTNTPYRFSFSVLAVAGDGSHAEIHDPLWFDVPDGVTISAASGASYLQPVPEPGTWMLMAAGLAVVAVAGRKASRARHQEIGSGRRIADLARWMAAGRSIASSPAVTAGARRGLRSRVPATRPIRTARRSRAPSARACGWAATRDRRARRPPSRAAAADAPPADGTGGRPARIPIRPGAARAPRAGT